MITRRSFVASVTLLGVTRKARPAIVGGFVNDSHVVGHQLRDGTLASLPREARRVSVAVVGGGIAGLSAAWRLRKRGVHDFVVLEMEADAGGNARAGRNDVSAYPWAAHYVPVPGPRTSLVRELFEELGVLRDGEWDERHLCHAPQERLFIHGR
jgi:NADPH-dependent 2,4-dienoyl-CoA reductase/sulfur reductase-like enzyme